MFIGPIFYREVSIAPRRKSFYISRMLYPVGLVLFMYTAWLLVAGTQNIQNIGDMARFGALLVSVLAPLQLALLTFMAAVQSSSSVAVEKDRKTLLLLLLTELNNSELVLGRMLGSLLPSLVNLLVAIPIFCAIVLFGGISFLQIFWIFAISLVSILTGGSWGTLVGLWREKSFQTLALTVMGIIAWIGATEAVAASSFVVGGFPIATVSNWLNPFTAITNVLSGADLSSFHQSPLGFLIFGLIGFVLLNLISILQVRVWNPGREIRPNQSKAEEDQSSIWGAEYDLKSGEEADQAAEKLRETHVDARVRTIDQKSRRVWDNPILWREMCTWAYGRKIMAIRAIYWAIAIIVFASSFWLFQTDSALSVTTGSTVYLPAITKVAAPFLFISLMIVNALAVTSITGERDGQSLDLLLVTDLTPKEFLIGKLGGVLFVALDSVIFPLLLCLLFWWYGLLGTENYLFLTLGLIVVNMFAVTLGLHCGRSFPFSRSAILSSLGTLFFLFLGTATCMLLLVSFAGNVDSQLASFLGFIVGGGIGLFWVLGSHSPSPALFTASIMMPIGMFYSLTSLLLRQYMAVFMVVGIVFSFAIAAMIMPALSEFSFSTGSQKSENDE